MVCVTCRFRFTEYPHALKGLGAEWTSTVEANGLIVVRRGPQYIRTTGWEHLKYTRILEAPNAYDIMVGFRVVVQQ
jgi:hypothetical protein